MPSRKERKRYTQIDAEDAEAAKSDSISSNSVKIQLKLPEEQVKELNVDLSTSIKKFRNIITDLTDIDPDRQRLIHFGKMLTGNDKTLEDFGVKNGDFVHLMPLPKDVSPSRVSPRRSERGYNDIGPLHEIPGLSMEFINNLSNEEYFQMVELNLWRARVRLLSSLMLFYYFLQLLGNLSMWFDSDEKYKRFEEGHAPSDLFFGADLVECMVGGLAAITGMMAAASTSTVHSAMYLRTSIEAGVMHFVTFVIYSHELLAGKIKINPHFTHQKPIDNAELEREAMTMGVVFSFMVNFFVWWTIVSIAVKYHQNIALNFPQQRTEGAEVDAEDVEDTQSIV